MKYQKSSHATYDVRYHIVWITKYRNPFMTKEIQDRLEKIIRWISKKLWVIIIKIWMEEDHVHMYCRIPLTKPISTIVWHIKRESSKAIKSYFYKEIKRWYWKTWNIWWVWYFVSSVWEINWEIISNYVEQQWEEENKIEEIEL